MGGVGSRWPRRGTAPRRGSDRRQHRAACSSRVSGYGNAAGKPAATTISPMIHPTHFARVAGFVDRTRERRHNRARRQTEPARRRRRFVVRADTDRADTKRQRDCAERSVRACADVSNVYRRGRCSATSELDAVWIVADRLHVIAGTRRAHGPRHPRWHCVDKLLPDSRPDCTPSAALVSVASAAIVATTHSTFAATSKRSNSK